MLSWTRAGRPETAYVSPALPRPRPHWMEMKTRLLFLLVPLALVALLAAGCGGGSGGGSVSNDSVASVGGTQISKSTFNALMAVAFAKYKSQGQAEPKVG